MPHDPQQVHGAADAVLGEEQRLLRPADRPQRLDDGGRVRHALVRMLVVQARLPTRSSRGCSERADPRRRLVADRGIERQRGRVRLRAGRQLAVAPGAVGVPLRGEVGRRVGCGRRRSFESSRPGPSCRRRSCRCRSRRRSRSCRPCATGDRRLELRRRAAAVDVDAAVEQRPCRCAARGRRSWPARRCCVNAAATATRSSVGGGPADDGSTRRRRPGWKANWPGRPGDAQRPDRLLRCGLKVDARVVAVPLRAGSRSRRSRRCVDVPPAAVEQHQARVVALAKRAAASRPRGGTPGRRGVSFNRPQMATLGWLRSRRTMPRTDSS